MNVVNLTQIPDFDALIIKPKYTPEWQATFLWSCPFYDIHPTCSCRIFTHDA